MIPETTSSPVRKMMFALAVFAVAGCAATQSGDDASGPQRPLSVYGAGGVVEQAPVRITYERLFPGKGGVRPGGVRSLVKADAPGDLATNAETQLLLYSLDRPDLRIIGTVAEGRYRIVARRSAGITRLSDLKGKRIATMVESSSGYFLALMLQRAGLDYSDITIVEPRPFSAIADALVKRDVDAISIWEPHSENAIERLGDDAVVFDGIGVYQERFNLNTTEAALADPARRAQIIAFVRALIADTKTMNSAPAEGQAMVAEAGKYSLDEVVRSWPHHTFEFTLPDDMLDLLVREEHWLAAYQKRPARSRAELSPLIDRSILEEATAPKP